MRHSHVQWRKSSYSAQEGECVEIGAWRKSSHSGPDGGNCVEAARVADIIAIRNSRNPHGPILRITPSDWHLILQTIRTGGI